MIADSLNHPDDQSLRALSLGQLTTAELVQVSAHLEACPICCVRIDQLSAKDQFVGRLQEVLETQDEVLINPTQRRSAVNVLRHLHGSRTDSFTTHTVPKQIGEYEILGEVGRGGMGVVYKARHRSLKRLVALKMILAGEFASPAQGMRFRLEAELAARMKHPNIVQLYEIGNIDGRPYLILEWVEGGSLETKLNGQAWPADDAARLLETLARAIHAAHGDGVIHRDLKPANIMLSTDGTPKITDFGLAQPVEAGKTLTQNGYLVGTPGYMAPEQASGNRALVGPGTDIYALGVILYQLCSGQLPFQSDNTLELLRAVQSDEPPRLSRKPANVSRDLEAIVLHCLEKEPHRRYPSALALAEDLGRFRDGRQVEARPVGTVARLVRSAQRRPLVTSLLALLVVSLLGGLGGVTWKWLDANEQRDRANANSRRADEEKSAALYQTYRASLAAASAALQNHNTADAARHLADAPASLRRWEWNHLSSRLDDSTEVIPITDGSGLLVGSKEQLWFGVPAKTGLQLTSLKDRQEKLIPMERARLRDTVCATHLGLRVSAWTGPTAFDLLDESGKVLCHVKTPDNEYSVPVVVSPDGTRLCLTLDGNRRQLAIFDTSTGSQSALCETLDAAIWAYAFSPDSKQLASGGEDRIVRLWNPLNGKLLTTCRGHSSKIVALTFSPDGTRLATASSDGTVRQWDTKTGLEAEPPYDRHASPVYSVAFSHDGEWIASAGDDRTIRVWRAKDRQDVAMLHGHTGRIDGLAFAPGDRQLASLSSRVGPFSSGDDTARIWDINPKATLPVLRGHTKAVYPVAVSPDGRWLASGSVDQTARLWDAATGEPSATLPLSNPVSVLAFHPDGTSLITGDNRLRIWDVATASLRSEIMLQGRDIRQITVSPDGKRVALTTTDFNSVRKRLSVYEIATGKLLLSTEGSSLTHSHDGRWLAALTADEKTVLLLDATTYEIAARFVGHENTIFNACFSPDSLRLATCSRDKTLRSWQIDNGECQVLRGHSDEVFAVAYHPDGTRLASGAQDGSVWLWDAQRGVALVRLPGHQSFVWSLAFSPDGASLVSGSGDSTVRLWDIAPLKERYRARREATALQPEAQRLVDRLLRETNSADGVVQALRADTSLSEKSLHAAWLVLQQRMTKQEK
jgi:eukaryotic-like serine/threonine-protein kinase